MPKFPIGLVWAPTSRFPSRLSWWLPIMQPTCVTWLKTYDINQVGKEAAQVLDMLGLLRNNVMCPSNGRTYTALKAACLPHDGWRVPIIYLGQGSANLPKLQEPPQNCACQMGDIYLHPDNPQTLDATVQIFIARRADKHLIFRLFSVR
jgi:hypothetical protein